VLSTNSAISFNRFGLINIIRIHVAAAGRLSVPIPVPIAIFGQNPEIDIQQDRLKAILTGL